MPYIWLIICIHQNLHGSRHYFISSSHQFYMMVCYFIAPSIIYQYFASPYPAALDSLQHLIYQSFISLILHIIRNTHHINMLIILHFLSLYGSRPWNLRHFLHHYSSFHQIKQSIFQPIYHHFYMMHFRKDYFMLM